MEYAILIPLLSALIVRCARPHAASNAGILACVAVAGSLLVTLYYGLTLMGHETLLMQGTLLSWNISPDNIMTFGWRLDGLSLVMCMLITGVGLLIHVYSLGYMKPYDHPRFFAYLNLFIALMLLLVLSDHLLLMFIGWEGVGLCSFLLIGFYHQHHKNMNAAKKAFIVNRIGDLGLILAMMIFIFLSQETGQGIALSFSSMEALINQHGNLLGQTILGWTLISWIGLFLFLGVCGKSAQVPLYIWLPDAMAGPTPVSALIHAASMVTAGVYLLTRMHFVFDASLWIPDLILWVGVITALLGSASALFQRDIKKVLAYSTVSQLGYMVMACGVGAYGAGMFHVITHGFFKALLFLCAGIVIKVHGSQDIYTMGQYRFKLPKVHVLFWIAALSMAGIFPLAGFFSKDHVLVSLFVANKWAFVMAEVGVVLTCAYIFRLLFIVFGGQPQPQPEKAQVSPHMLVPCLVLGLGILVLGWLWTPHYFHMPSIWVTWLQPWIAKKSAMVSSGVEMGVGFFSLLLSVAGILITRRLYRNGHETDQVVHARYPEVFGMLTHAFYVDEVYERTIVFRQKTHASRESADAPSTNSLFHLLAVIKGMIDRYIVDGLVHWFAWLPQFLGSVYARIQDGHIQHYIRWITMGSLFLLFYWFLWITGLL